MKVKEVLGGNLEEFCDGSLEKLCGVILERILGMNLEGVRDVNLEEIFVVKREEVLGVSLEEILVVRLEEALVEEVPLDDCTALGTHWCRSVAVEPKVLHYQCEHAKRILYNTENCESDKRRVCVQSRSESKSCNHTPGSQHMSKL